MQKNKINCMTKLNQNEQLVISSADLRSACQKLGIICKDKYIRAFYQKEKRIQIAIAKTLNATDVLDIRTNGPFLGFKDPRFEDTWNTTEILVEYITTTCLGLADITASFLHEAFSLKQNKLIYFSRISSLLQKATTHSQLAKMLSQKIDNILVSDEYIYLSDLNNYIKHNDVVDLSFQIVISNIPGYFKIKEFKHKDQHEKISLKDFFEIIETFKMVLLEIYQDILDMADA